MDSTITISSINDFLFCPRSLYLHAIYSKFDQFVYHDLPQKLGNLAHDNIDNGRYSTLKDILQNYSVYSEKYGLIGKIDLFFIQDGILIERKYRVKNIYKGFKFQLFAQMLCLEEKGYKVNKLYIHSLSDNKRYFISKPTKGDLEELKNVLSQMYHFDNNLLKYHQCSHCFSNIYDQLNW